MKHLPFILMGAGGVGLGLLFLVKKVHAAPSLQAKVSDKIATSNDPNLLKQLAAGLQKSGDTQAAFVALQKAANITGVPQSVPGMIAMNPITITPGSGSSSPTTYRVVSGDIPGAIAKRFGIALSALAKANGTSSSRIMGGQIRLGETLKLPVGVVDSGAASHANGLAT